MRDFSKLSPKVAAYNEVLQAKEVTVKQNRSCSICGKVIPKGQRAVTACRMIDKKYNKTYRYVIDSGLSAGRFRFVQQRHWMCCDCAENMTIKQSNRLKANILESEDFEKLSYEQQLDIVNKLYNKGEIAAKEYQDIEDSLIHAMAFRDAMADEF